MFSDIESVFSIVHNLHSEDFLIWMMQNPGERTASSGNLYILFTAVFIG